MSDEDVFPELYAVSKVAGERSENAHVVEFTPEKLFQVGNIAFVIGHLCVCNRAEFSSSHTRFARLHERKLYKSSLTRLVHHLADGFLKIRLTHVCWSAFFHKFINIAWGVFHNFYQREYVWSMETVKVLLEDIYEVFEQSYLPVKDAEMTSEVMEKFNWVLYECFYHK